MLSHGRHAPGREGIETVTVSAGAQAYLGARAAWPLGDMMIDGVPRGARCADALSFGAAQRSCWRQCLFGSRLHGHQDERAVRVFGHDATHPIGASASSPRARSRWWQRRASLRATERAARCLPTRWATCS